MRKCENCLEMSRKIVWKCRIHRWAYTWYQVLNCWVWHALTAWAWQIIIIIMTYTKNLISLGILPVWSESSMSLTTLKAPSADSDLTRRMPRLNWVFAGFTGHFLDFVLLRLILHGRAGPWENIYYVICEQQKRRSAFASARSDQRLYCSLSW